MIFRRGSLSRRAGFCLLTMVTVAATAGAVLTAATPAAASTVAFHRASSWNTGYIGTVTVANDATKPKAWSVAFVLPEGTSIATIWNAVMVRDGNRYRVTGETWNATLDGGTSTAFGWVAQGVGDPADLVVDPSASDDPTSPPTPQLPQTPNACGPTPTPFSGAPSGALSGASTATGVAGSDVKPPTKPQNLRVTLSPTLLCWMWDPSTDNVGVVGYEVLKADSTVLDVTRATSYGIARAGSEQYGTFYCWVRSFDAAGNRSELAWQAISIDPGAPLTPTWTAAPTPKLSTVNPAI